MKFGKQKPVLDQMIEDYAKLEGSASRTATKKLLADARFWSLTDTQKLIILQVIGLITA